jgi:thiamine kinase-like enzyme
MLAERFNDLLDGCDELIATTGGPWGLVHMDPTSGNLLDTAGGWVWVDFEYAGLGPLALDLALTTRRILRSRGPERAAQYLAGYVDGGGVVETVEILRLAPIADVLSAIDECIKWRDPSTHEEAQRRLGILDDPLGRGPSNH